FIELAGLPVEFVYASKLPYRNLFFFSSRRRHTRSYGDWSSDVCSSDLNPSLAQAFRRTLHIRRMSFAPPALITAEHEVEVFDCGNESLNLYLKRYALTNTAAGTARTDRKSVV